MRQAIESAAKLHLISIKIDKIKTETRIKRAAHTAAISFLQDKRFSRHQAFLNPKPAFASEITAGK
jgi:hypothetical protein